MTPLTHPALTSDEIVEGRPASALDEPSLAEIFIEARTANAFLDRAIPHRLLDRALELALLGPTSANSLPLRIVFVESREAKEKLGPALSEGNRDKTMAAPVTAVVAADLKYFEHFPHLFSERGEMLKNKFGGMPERISSSRYDPSVSTPARWPASGEASLIAHSLPTDGSCRRT